MTRNLFNTRQTFTLANGKQGTLYSLPALEVSRPRQDFAPAGFHPHRAGSGAAQLRRQEDYRGACAPTGELAAERAAHRGDSLRRGAHRAAGLHRRAAAGRSRRDARCRRADWARTRKSSSRWCRWTWWWTTRCRSITTTARMRCSSTWKWNSSATTSATSS